MDLVDCVPQALTGLEFRLFACRNGDLVAGPRIASFGRRARADRKRSEPDETNLVPVFNAAVIPSKTASTALVASALVKPAFF